MVMFPPDHHLPKSKDGSEPILGGSIAMNRILLQLRDRSSDLDRVHWGAVLVSAYTLFRNIYTKDAKPEELAARFRMDIDLFRLYLDAYLTVSHTPALKIPLVIYVPDYSYIQKEYLRDQSPQTIDILEKFMVFIKGLPPGEVLYGTSDGSTLWGLSVGNKNMLPHIELAHWLQNKALASQQFGYKFSKPVMLISHCPIDLHISRRLPNVYLVESYQGIPRSTREFGKKLDKGNDTIPFSIATHRAFGDAVHLKGLATKEQRTKLLETAVSRKWMSLPAETVMREVISILGSSIAEITKLKL